MAGSESRPPLAKAEGPALLGVPYKRAVVMQAGSKDGAGRGRAAASTIRSGVRATRSVATRLAFIVADAKGQIRCGNYKHWPVLVHLFSAVTVNASLDVRVGPRNRAEVPGVVPPLDARGRSKYLDGDVPI